MISRVDIPPRTACQPRLHWLITREECDPLPNNIYFYPEHAQSTTPNPLRPIHLRRMRYKKIRKQDEHDTSRRTRGIPVVDSSDSSLYIIAFGAVEVFLVLSVLGLHVNLI